MEINYSWFDMVYYLTEKIDKKTQMETIKRILNAFLNDNPEVGFINSMVGLILFLLCYCTETQAFYLFNQLYKEILPSYLYPNQFKKFAKDIEGDVKYMMELLKYSLIYFTFTKGLI